MTLQEQRDDLEKATRYLDSKIVELNYKKNVLTNAFNQIDANKEDMLTSNSILAQEVRKIMSEINYNK